MMETKRGRPKTGLGHRDDAMLQMFDFEGEVAAFRKLIQEHYRLQRAQIDAMDERIRTAATSWRYAELVDEMVAEKLAGRS